MRGATDSARCRPHAGHRPVGRRSANNGRSPRRTLRRRVPAIQRRRLRALRACRRLRSRRPRCPSSDPVRLGLFELRPLPSPESRPKRRVRPGTDRPNRSDCFADELKDDALLAMQHCRVCPFGTTASLSNSMDRVGARRHAAQAADFRFHRAPAAPMMLRPTRKQRRIFQSARRRLQFIFGGQLRVSACPSRHQAYSASYITMPCFSIS